MVLWGQWNLYNFGNHRLLTLTMQLVCDDEMQRLWCMLESDGQTAFLSLLSPSWPQHALKACHQAMSPQTGENLGPYHV